jgi:hypothetical protein
MQESQKPKDIAVETVRANARQPPDKIKPTPDQAQNGNWPDVPSGWPNSRRCREAGPIFLELEATAGTCKRRPTTGVFAEAGHESLVWPCDDLRLRDGCSARRWFCCRSSTAIAMTVTGE